MTRRPVTVCVVSEQAIVAAGVRGVIAEHADPAHPFVSVTDPNDADVVVYDVFNLALPGDCSNGELDKLVATHPGRVLALSRLLQPGLTARALAAGAVAPVSIGADADELLGLLDAAASGDLAHDPELARRNHADLALRLGGNVGLTRRQQTVLVRIAAGYSNQQIADDLYVTINTVKSTIRATYTRIGVQNRAHAVAWAIEHGYVSPDLPPRQGGTAER